jgi:non-specific serine/threonine protein kinase
MDTARLDVPPPAQATFAELLRQYRLAAGLSQEALAERAGLSVQALSAMENGRRQTPYRHTVALLARAIGLADAQTAALEAAIVRRRVPSSGQAPLPARHKPETKPEHETGGDAVAPMCSAQPSRTNLPVALTSFIGREREQGEVRALLDAARLVTLTGAGGAGKTRLALAVAEAVLGEHPDGIWLVELAALADPTLVVQAVVAALGLREEPHRPLLATLIDYLTEKHLLLVLDNCEHLVSPCAELAAALLQRCPCVQILATSRETLSVPGETTYRVPSLALPDLARLPEPERLAGYEAVQLFVQRAQSRRPGFTLSAQNAPAVAEICVQLDGIPLAIELAAAREGSLPVGAIAARLGERFRLLIGGPRTVLPRQQTLRATLDWSYDLLSEGEQRLLDRLSVFAGGCTLEAAEAVCSGEGIAAREMLDLLGSLVNKSLVLLEEREDNPQGAGRYRLLETVLQYGQERLAAAGGAPAARDRHLAWCLALAEEAEPRLTGPEQGAWLDRLEAEHDNLRAALGWALEGGEAETALEFAAALWRFWYIRGHLGEGRRWLEQALARDGGDGRASSRAKGLGGAGVLAFYQGEYSRAAALSGAALALGRQAGDRAIIALALHGLALVARMGGQKSTARAMYEEALGHLREVGDKWGIAYTLGRLGGILWWQGQLGGAWSLTQESLTLFRAVGERHGQASSLQMLGMLAHARGDLPAARAFYEQSLAVSREIDDRHGIVRALFHLAEHHVGAQDYAVARVYAEQAFAHASADGDRHTMARCLVNLGRLAAGQGLPVEATRLFAAGEALHEALALSLPGQPLDSAGGAPAAEVTLCASGPRTGGKAESDAPAPEQKQATTLFSEHLRYGPDLVTLRRQLGTDFAATWAEGRLVPLQQVVAAFLSAPQPAQRTRPSGALPSAPAHPALPSHPALLTPREKEVLSLVARGLTDAQVAEALVVSTRTINSHLTSIYSKLGVSSRTAAARLALDHGLV